MIPPIIKDIWFIIAIIVTLVMFKFFLKSRKVLTAGKLRMLDQAETIWNKFMANQRDHENPTLTTVQASARQKFGNAVREHPIAGQFTKTMDNNEIFGFLFDQQFLRGIGLAGNTLFDFIGRLQGFFGGGKKKALEDEEEQPDNSFWKQ